MGSPPVAFTFGTGMMHSSGLFRAALEACEIPSARGIFLTKYRDQLPDSLPPSVIHCAFAPFRKLFPHCAAVVHHGGIGTVAKAMAAGVPQLIQPICLDQIENGMRVRRLGVGDCLRAKRADGKQIAAALTALMTDDFRTNCRRFMTHFDKADAFATAAELIEKLAMDRATISLREHP